MSLDYRLCESVFSRNITHNLTTMAEAAGLYYVLWRPEEIGIETAEEAIPLLEAGLAALKSDPDKFKLYDAPNGWGTYAHFVPFVEEVLDGCRSYPFARIEVSR